MQVRAIDTTRRRDVMQFIRFPFALYDGCAEWVPPLLPDMRLALDRDRYPFYRESEADHFVVESEGQILGRITALVNRPYNAYHGTKTAFFYYFDTVDDRHVSRMLFEAAFDWARARDLETIYGPQGLLRADGHGLLVEGFEHQAVMGIAYNYPYYADLVEDAGFQKSHDYHSAYLTAGYDLPQRFYDIAERVKARRGYRVQSFKSRRELTALAPALHKIYQSAFVQVWGYYPVTLREIETLIARIASIADPRLIKVVLKGDEPIGFVIAYPDISDAVQRIKGRMWPLGWLHLLLAPRRTKWVVFNGVGLLPAYQGVGANTVLYTELAKTIKDNHYQFEYGDLVQVAETNMQSMGDMTALRPTWYKRHSVYVRAL